MSLHKLLPMVVYGTIKSNYSQLTNGGDGMCLSFLSLDPVVGILPMKRDAFTVLFNNVTRGDFGHWGWSEFDANLAKKQGEQVYQIFSKLALTNGLSRLWATPTNLIVQGDSKCFEAISSKICKVMAEVLGEIDFRPVPHGEAAPFIFSFKMPA